MDPAPYLAVLAERFGMDPTWFTERYHFFEGGKKYVYILAAGHAPPTGPEIAFSGIKLMRIKMKVPKLTTEAAVAVGEQATRNFVELDHAGTARYLAREDIPLSAQAASACTGPGYALVRFGPVTIGTGYLEPVDAATETGAPDTAGGSEPGTTGRPVYHLRSWFPKHWSEVVSIR